MKLYETPVVTIELDTLAKLIDEVFKEGMSIPYKFRNQDWCEDKVDSFKHEVVSQVLS